MKFIRWILGKIILIVDSIFAPTPEARSPEAQAKLDQATAGLLLYQFETCPFCVKVRRHIKKLGMKIALRDAHPGTQGGTELLKGGGEMQVPCLLITDKNGGRRWMYESSTIMEYLSDLAHPKNSATS